LEVSHFSWRGRTRPGGFRARSAQAFEKLTPFDFANFSWDSVRRPRNYVATLLLLSVFLVSEVDGFYLKHLLWLRSDHPLVIIRLVGMFLWSVRPTLRCDPRLS
jgi:phosphatidylserine synthase 2